MKLTALEIRKHEFARAFRGYDAEEVDAFLNMVAQHWQTLSQDMQRMEDRLEEQTQRVNHYLKVEEALEHALENARAMSKEKLDAATSQATEQVREAAQEADAKVKAADQKARDLVREAEEEVRSIRERASRELRDIERRVERARADALSELSSLDGDRTRFLEGFRAFLKNQMDALGRYEASHPGPSLANFLATERSGEQSEDSGPDAVDPDPELRVSGEEYEVMTADEGLEDLDDASDWEPAEEDEDRMIFELEADAEMSPDSHGAEGEDEEFEDDPARSRSESRFPRVPSLDFMADLPSAEDGFEGDSSDDSAGLPTDRPDKASEKAFGAEEEIRKIRRILEDLDK